MFEWMHVDCFANLLQLACMLPQKEDHLRNRTTKVCIVLVPFLLSAIDLRSNNTIFLKSRTDLQFLLAVSERFGSSYLTHIELPVFLVAVGDDEADLRFLPSAIHPRIKGYLIAGYI